MTCKLFGLCPCQVEGDGKKCIENVAQAHGSKKLVELAKKLEEAYAYRRYHRINFWKPYPKQHTFQSLGATKRERLFSAGNQVGKSDTGADETAYHLTGIYPEHWQGKRFDHPVRGWAVGETGLVVRDVQQKKLLGSPGVTADWGTGFIPREFILDSSLARGVTDAVDTVQVKHFTDGVEDGVSVVMFKSYEQGRQKLQGDTIDFAWCDEEPPQEIYSEILARLTGEGIVFTTFTPLLGRTELVERYLAPHGDRAMINMTLDDAEHFTPEEKKKRYEGYQDYEREARAKGIPLLGSGRVYPFDEGLLVEPPLTYVPEHWPRIWGIDFGIDHPFAAILLLWDRDNDVVHVHHVLKMVSGLPLNHSAALKSIGERVPVAWPHDGHNREKGSGVPLAALYKQEGLRMLPIHAQFATGGYQVEAGVMDIAKRITQSKLKVAAHLSEFFEEYRFYHRKDGLIVKVRDDLMDALRMGIMMLRYGQAVPLGKGKPDRRSGGGLASGVDFDLD